MESLTENPYEKYLPQNPYLSEYPYIYLVENPYIREIWIGNPY